MKPFKLLFFLGIMTFGSISTNAQNEMYGGITLEQLTYNKSSVYSIGADVYAPFGNRFTLNYSLKLGLSKDYSIAFHSPVSTLLGTYLIALNGELPGIASLGLLCLAIPEGVGVYLGPDGQALHLSVNPLGMDYFESPDKALDYIGMSCSAVARIHYKMKSYFPSYITPMVGLYYRYGQSNFSEQYGIRFGVSFGVASKRTDAGSSLQELLYE
ncbi:MAG: hypothetical protein NWQ44_00585 [Flavobacteriales bacterium]|jgi:hypothetical protein|nr:hypothetical protein [Flavobacteriales bacterium]MDP4950203.1 hypothetical protein [Flavobacteriales bacterium]